MRKVRLTIGTTDYAIPYCNARPPLRIEELETIVIVECPYFNETGYGDTFDEALMDLGRSLVELKLLGQKLIKNGKKLSPEWQRIIECVK